MSIVRITLTDDILKVISGLRFEKFSFSKDSENKRYGWGIDEYGMYGGTYVLEDISILIGRYNEHIPGTEENPLGVEFPEELTNYMWEIHDYIVENLEYIENLIHTYINKGGLTPGTYKCKSNELDWIKEK